MIKKALINFAMIQTVIFIVSVNLGFQVPVESGHLSAVGFIWLVSFGLSFLPALLTSFAFAALTK